MQLNERTRRRTSICFSNTLSHSSCLATQRLASRQSQVATSSSLFELQNSGQCEWPNVEAFKLNFQERPSLCQIKPSHGRPGRLIKCQYLACNLVEVRLSARANSNQFVVVVVVCVSVCLSVRVSQVLPHARQASPPLQSNQGCRPPNSAHRVYLLGRRLSVRPDMQKMSSLYRRCRFPPPVHLRRLLDGSIDGTRMSSRRRAERGQPSADTSGGPTRSWLLADETNDLIWGQLNFSSRPERRIHSIYSLHQPLD